MLIDLWFGLIVVLWAGYVVLEGFDFGVGLLYPIMGRTETEKRVVYNTIGPVWDGNEVWLLVAGGATFAAFPEWYASLFSGYYLALALILVGLILRGSGIELRSKAATQSGRAWCDRAFVVGSALPALLWGVALANFVRGVPIDGQHVVHASLWSLLSPYALLGGVTSVLLFATHGAHFLALRTTDELRARALGIGKVVTPAAVVSALAFVGATWAQRANTVSVITSVVAAVGLLTALWGAREEREVLAFVGTSVTCVMVPVFIFASTWPYAIVGRGSGSVGLKLTTAASSHTTLVVMTVVAVVMTPVVLAYQAWTYWVFRQRVTLPPVSVTDPHPAIPGRRPATVSS